MLVFVVVVGVTVVHGDLESLVEHHESEQMRTLSARDRHARPRLQLYGETPSEWHSDGSRRCLDIVIQSSTVLLPYQGPVCIWDTIHARTPWPETQDATSHRTIESRAPDHSCDGTRRTVVVEDVFLEALVVVLGVFVVVDGIVCAL